MTETIARIAANGQIELVSENEFAAALSSANPPKAGTILDHPILAVSQWKIQTHPVTKSPILTFLLPSNIELVFALDAEGARAMGEALQRFGVGPLGPTTPVLQ
jgi:hypothetical protein